MSFSTLDFFTSLVGLDPFEKTTSTLSDRVDHSFDDFALLTSTRCFEILLQVQFHKDSHAAISNVVKGQLVSTAQNVVGTNLRVENFVTFQTILPPCCWRFLRYTIARVVSSFFHIHRFLLTFDMNLLHLCVRANCHCPHLWLLLLILPWWLEGIMWTVSCHTTHVTEDDDSLRPLC